MSVIQVLCCGCSLDAVEVRGKRLCCAGRRCDAFPVQRIMIPIQFEQALFGHYIFMQLLWILHEVPLICIECKAVFITGICLLETHHIL